MIKFYRGTKAKYQESPSTYTDGLFFTTDTEEILVNEESYGKNANASVTSEDIIVAGGPLANEVTDNWPTEWVKDGNKVIPAGTSIQSVFQGLLLKTVNGTVSWGSKTWNPSLGAPTVTLSSNGPAEIGSTVTCTVTSNSNVSGNKRSATCTASQGHFTSLDGSYVSGNKTVSIDGTTSGSVALAYTWNGTDLTSFTSGSTALKIASVMNGEDLPEFDDLAKATISELANLITAQVVTKLHELGFHFDLTPPALFVGQKMEVAALGGEKVEALIVPLLTEFGKVEINFSIRERV